MAQRFWTYNFAILAFYLLPAVSWAAGRHAIVIGNETYTNGIYQQVNLATPISDASLYRSMLPDLGWEISNFEWEDLTAPQMINALDVSIETGDEIVLIYSGHGWSDERDYYLLPSLRVGEEEYVNNEALIDAESIALSEIVRRLHEKRPKRIVLIIDACNNEPIKRSLRPTRPDVSFQDYTDVELLILYSSSPGGVAYDQLSPDEDLNENPYSVFTRLFAPRLAAGNPLLEDFIQARVDVETLMAQNPRMPRSQYQIPHIVYDNINGQFSMKAPVVEPRTEPQPEPEAVEPESIGWQSDPEICRTNVTALDEALEARRQDGWDRVSREAHIVDCIYNGALARLAIAGLSFNVDDNEMVTFTQTETSSPLRSGEALERLIARSPTVGNISLTRPTLEEFRETLAQTSFEDGASLAGIVFSQNDTRPVRLVIE
ncbi:MAG: caspase family protein [Pseudomonadota bacterium]